MKYPRLLENTLLMAHDYLVYFRDLHLAATYLSAPQRLAHFLCDLAKKVGHPVPHGVALRITNEQLAVQANMTHFTVSRLLTEWHRRGLVIKGRAIVVVRRPEELLRVQA